MKSKLSCVSPMCHGPSTSMVHEAEMLFRKVGKFLFFLLWSSGTMPYICLELGFRGWLNWNLLHCQIAFCGLIVCRPYCLTGSSPFCVSYCRLIGLMGQPSMLCQRPDFFSGKKLSKISEVYLIFINVMWIWTDIGYHLCSVYQIKIRSS